MISARLGPTQVNDDLAGLSNVLNIFVNALSIIYFTVSRANY